MRWRQWPGILLGSAFFHSAALHATEPVKIMACGDSFWASGVELAMIQDGLTAAGIRFDFVGSARHKASADPEHEAVGGKRLEDMLNGRTLPATPEKNNKPLRELLAAYQPDCILFEGGINDIYGGNRAPEQILETVRKLAAVAQELRPDARVIFSTITPVVIGSNERNNAEKMDRITAYNRRLPAVVEELRRGGLRASLVDAFSAWPDVKTMTAGDGLHPNDAGHRALARAWVEGIRKALEP